MRMESVFTLTLPAETLWRHTGIRFLTANHNQEKNQNIRQKNWSKSFTSSKKAMPLTTDRQCQLTWANAQIFGLITRSFTEIELKVRFF